MKKLLAIFAVALGIGAVHAAEVELEYGYESGRYAPNINGPKVDSQFFVMTPHWEFGHYDIGLKFEQSRNMVDGASLEDKLELQVQRDFYKSGKFSSALQIGLGEDFNQYGKTSNTDFSYYQVSIKPKYQLTEQLAILSRYRYRNAFSSGHYFESNTVDLGIAYKLNKNVELAVGAYKKFGGDEHANGFVTGLTLGF